MCLIAFIASYSSLECATEPLFRLLAVHQISGEGLEEEQNSSHSSSGVALMQINYLTEDFSGHSGNKRNWQLGRLSFGIDMFSWGIKGAQGHSDLFSSVSKRR